MNRQELATKVQNLVNQAYLHGIDNKYYKGMMHEAEKLRYPITLAEFLGWEEGVEYKDEKGFRYRLKGPNDLQTYYDNSETWNYFDLEWNGYVIDRLRNAKKVEDKKFYAKIKGWELITSTYCHFGLDDFSELEVVDRIDGYRLSKSEWNELGINDENADFEEV